MIYILALNTVEATAYAAQVLGIPARDMGWKMICITGTEALPPRITEEDEVIATPNFWALVDHERTREEAWRARDDRSRRAILDRAETVHVIVSAVIYRGGKVLPPYDVPETMDRESVEAWLNEA